MGRRRAAKDPRKYCDQIRHTWLTQKPVALATPSVPKSCLMRNHTHWSRRSCILRVSCFIANSSSLSCSGLAICRGLISPHYTLLAHRTQVCRRTASIGLSLSGTRMNPVSKTFRTLARVYLAHRQSCGYWSTLDWPALVGSSNSVKKNTGGYFFRNLGRQKIIHAARAFQFGSSLVNLRLKLVSQITSRSQTGFGIRSDQRWECVVHIFECAYRAR